MWEYTDKVKEHFINPRNVGEVENPDGVGEVGSMACGDALKLSFKLDENERIKEAKFQTFGCASAIASSSAMTEMMIGKTIEEAEKITNDDIADYLGGLPKEKMHCSVLGRDALEKAIYCYRGEDEKVIDGNIICECFGVTDKEIERAVTENHLKTRFFGYLASVWVLIRIRLGRNLQRVFGRLRPTSPASFSIIEAVGQ